MRRGWGWGAGGLGGRTVSTIGYGYLTFIYVSVVVWEMKEEAKRFGATVAVTCAFHQRVYINIFRNDGGFQ